MIRFHYGATIENNTVKNIVPLTTDEYRFMVDRNKAYARCIQLNDDVQVQIWTWQPCSISTFKHLLGHESYALTDTYTEYDDDQETLVTLNRFEVRRHAFDTRRTPDEIVGWHWFDKEPEYLALSQAAALDRLREVNWERIVDAINGGADPSATVIDCDDVVLHIRRDGDSLIVHHISELT